MNIICSAHLLLKIPSCITKVNLILTMLNKQHTPGSMTVLLLLVLILTYSRARIQIPVLTICTLTTFSLLLVKDGKNLCSILMSKKTLLISSTESKTCAVKDDRHEGSNLRFPQRKSVNEQRMKSRKTVKVFPEGT